MKRHREPEAPAETKAAFADAAERGPTLVREDVLGRARASPWSGKERGPKRHDYVAAARRWLEATFAGTVTLRADAERHGLLRAHLEGVGWVDKLNEPAPLSAAQLEGWGDD